MLDGLATTVEGRSVLSRDSLPDRSAQEDHQSFLDGQRIRHLVDRDGEFVWRMLRRLGLSDADADDSAQEVFLIAARRIRELEPEKERSFLIGTAIRVASVWRRGESRFRRRVDSAASVPLDPVPDPEQLAERYRLRRDLDSLLDQLDLDLRSVFVLAEIEELSAPEIADLLDLKLGTVASRLRRAREHFREAVKRLDARRAFRGDHP